MYCTLNLHELVEATMSLKLNIDDFGDKEEEDNDDNEDDDLSQ